MSDFQLEPWIQAQGARVEALLADRLRRLEAAPRRLVEAMGYSLLAGGKRLRPLLCLAFAEAVKGGTPGTAAEDAACALEYIHTYSLVHDDLPAMDNDDLRRGRPTSHKVHGEAMAILAGDALLTEAFALLATGPEPQRAALVARLAQAAGAVGMVGGQVLDIAEDRPAEEAYLTRLHRAKTGALLRAACTLGVVAEGGTHLQISAAERYGDAVGLAFQIADDVLDVTSSAEAMGKPTGADAAAGRHTYPAVLGLEASRARGRALVAEAFRAVRALEPSPGPLGALARYAVERST
ncbi:MAG TPA: farnesyl diphosphate synthase [Myxococcaceae bacterium]|nr:farnesyl diphosphate synthase [Myxococcaceae bacterium]